MFDDLAKKFRDGQANLHEMTVRQKAMALLHFVRSENLTGMVDPENNYRNIRNCLIGHALFDEEHQSLPIISSAIYCCLATRIGLTSACCAFPGHVHSMVFANDGETLDGKPTGKPSSTLDGTEKMFLDPFQLDPRAGLH